MDGVSYCPMSKLQALVATSTTEAEYIAGGMAVKEALWLPTLLGDILGRDPMIRLYCDNRSALKVMTQHTAGGKESDKAHRYTTPFH
jgi:hypothetical protein